MLYGIDTSMPHLSRSELVKKLVKQLKENQQSLIYSPPSTGKTSLLLLLEKKLCELPESDDLANVNFVLIQCPRHRSEAAFSTIKKLAKLDLTMPQNCKDVRSTILVLDDSHHWFANEELWASLLRITDSRVLPNFRFLYVATQLLSKANPSPVFFKSLKRLGLKDFLVSQDELREIGQKKNVQFGKTFTRVLEAECAGIIGLYTITVDFLEVDFGQTTPEESAVLQHFYSSKFAEYMSRCFGIDLDKEKHLDQDAMQVLLNLYCSAKPVVVQANQSMKEGFARLIEAGILVGGESLYQFSSPYAKRYFFHYLFQGKRAEKYPENLKKLVLAVIGSMSSSQLQKSTVPGDFPKEAAFQQVFVVGLAANTPPHVCICPELGRVFPAVEGKEPEKIEGEIDFYIDGDIRWGIEIHIKGDRLQDHLARCAPTGKYGALNMKSYVVLDFRCGGEGTVKSIERYQKDENMTQVQLQLRQKRMVVVFPTDDVGKANFSECTVLSGAKSNFEKTKVILQS